MIVFVIALAAFVFVVITVRIVVVEPIRRRARLEGDLPPGGGELDGLRDAIEDATVLGTARHGYTNPILQNT